MYRPADAELNLMRVRSLVLGMVLLGLSGAASAQSIIWEKQHVLSGPMTMGQPLTYRDPQGNTYLAGLASGRIVVEKFSPSGVSLWRNVDQSQLSQATVNSFAVNQSGQVFVTGLYSPLPPGAIYIEELTSAGAFKWRVQADPSGWPHPRVLIASNGDPLLSFVNNGLSTMCFSATDGSLRWSTKLNGSDLTPSRMYAKNGFAYAILAPKSIVRIDETNGNILWTHLHVNETYGGQWVPDLTTVDMDIMANGNVLVAGDSAIEILSAADGAILQRAHPAINMSFPIQYPVYPVIEAGADGSVICSGYDWTNHWKIAGLDANLNATWIVVSPNTMNNDMLAHPDGAGGAFIAQDGFPEEFEIRMGLYCGGA